MVDFPKPNLAGRQTSGSRNLDKIRADVAHFAEEAGRRPRMMVVKLAESDHDRSVRQIATAFADIGFDVDVGPLAQTPEDIARQAIENDVHVVGISGETAGHKVSALTEALRNHGSNDIVVVCVAAHGPVSTHIPEAAADILGLIRKQFMAA